jgi:hypothetical protein
VRADFEDVDLDAELVERVAEIQVVGGIAADAERAARLEVDLVRLRHQEVLLLGRIAAEGDDLLAVLAKVLQRGGDRAQLRQPAARQVLRIEQQHLDSRVVRGPVNGIDEVAYQCLRLVVTGERAERAVPRARRQLLDESPFRADDQCRARRHQRQRLPHGHQQDGEQREQQQQVQPLAQPVEDPPRETEKPP